MSTKETTQPAKPAKTGKKGNPVPTRFDPPEEEFIAALRDKTGLKPAEIIRRAGRYAFPRFLSGEVSILDQVPTQAEEGARA